MQDTSESELKMIREASKRSQPIGSAKFAAEIEEKLGVRVSLNKPGRPKKDFEVNESSVLYGSY